MKKNKISQKQLINIINHISENKKTKNGELPNIVFNFTINDQEGYQIDFSKIKKISYTNFEDHESLQKTWGSLTKTTEDTYEIKLSKKMIYKAKIIFTLAHEYIHFIIDQLLFAGIEIDEYEDLTIMKQNVESYRNNKYEPLIETLASKYILSDDNFNEFVENWLNKNNKNTSQLLIYELNKQFNLSLAAAAIRVEEYINS